MDFPVIQFVPLVSCPVMDTSVNSLSLSSLYPLVRYLQVLLRPLTPSLLQDEQIPAMDRICDAGLLSSMEEAIYSSLRLTYLSYTGHGHDIRNLQ